jgi:crossover junction endodeoxyribonuclease RuvC
MVILGIDPGFRFAGYGILKKEAHKSYLLDYGLLKLPQSEDLSKRLGMFHSFFDQKIIQWHVTDLALETPFLGKNAQNFLKLGYLRGALYLLANHHTLALHEFSPRQIKQAITGFGGADKDQVARVVMQLFPGMKQPEKEDVTDALAVTICGLWHNKGMQSL